MITSRTSQGAIHGQRIRRLECAVTSTIRSLSTMAVDQVQNHLLKLRRRIRADQLSEDEIRRSYEKPKWIRWHARFTAPLQRFRRRTLERIAPKQDQTERGAMTG